MSDSPKSLRGPGKLCYHLRVSRRRRSVGLTITDTGDLVVHAPRGLSREAIHRVIAKNRAWIEGKQAKCREALEQVQAGRLYYLGKAYRVQVNPQGPAGLRWVEDIVHLNVESSAADPWPQLLDWYRREAATLLAQRVGSFAARLGLTPPPLELRPWRRRWGECRIDGHLRFNWRLILLPPDIVDYVVVHELAHLLVPGHTPAFWRQVGKYLPDYAERRRWLKEFGSPFLFWKFEVQEDHGHTTETGYFR
jgi:predicted metal-dependent hydrolase